MLDAKKRNLYIGLITASLLATAGVWFFNFSSTGTVTPGLPNQSLMPGTNQLAPTTASPNQSGNVAAPVSTAPVGATTTTKPGTLKDGEFPMPGVFPNSPDYDLSVLESSVYKNLKDYQSLMVDEKDLGREDPFKPTQ